MPTYIAHSSPVHRAESNYIAMIALGPFGLDDHLEQVWLRRDAGGAVLCCIPFCAYGVALGDTVQLSGDGSTVVAITQRSGRRTLRVLVPGDQGRVETRAAAAVIQQQAARADLLSEWSGDRHVAIDVPPGATPTPLIDHLETNHVHWEWNDAKPFTT